MVCKASYDDSYHLFELTPSLLPIVHRAPGTTGLPQALNWYRDLLCTCCWQEWAATTGLLTPSLNFRHYAQMSPAKGGPSCPCSKFASFPPSHPIHISYITFFFVVHVILEYKFHLFIYHLCGLVKGPWEHAFYVTHYCTLQFLAAVPIQ